MGWTRRLFLSKKSNFGQRGLGVPSSPVISAPAPASSATPVTAKAATPVKTTSAAPTNRSRNPLVYEAMKLQRGELTTLSPHLAMFLGSSFQPGPVSNSNFEDLKVAAFSNVPVALATTIKTGIVKYKIKLCFAEISRKSDLIECEPN